MVYITVLVEPTTKEFVVSESQKSDKRYEPARRYEDLNQFDHTGLGLLLRILQFLFIFLFFGMIIYAFITHGSIWHSFFIPFYIILPIVIVVMEIISKRNDDMWIKGKSKSINDKTDLGREIFVPEWIPYGDGYAVYHQYAIDPEGIELIDKAIVKAKGMMPRPADIIILDSDNSTTIRLSRKEGADTKSRTRRDKAFEFTPVYKDGEFDKFEAESAENFY